MSSSQQRLCREYTVADIALCPGLTAGERPSLDRCSVRKLYPAGQLIADVLPIEEWCATILSGVVKLTKSLPDGRQQIVALLFPSEFLGRPFKPASPYAAETATAVELCCYRLREFERLLAEQAELKQLFLERTLDAVDEAREWMVVLGRKNAREKVAALLLMIARHSAPDTVGRLCSLQRFAHRAPAITH